MVSYPPGDVSANIKPLLNKISGARGFYEQKTISFHYQTRSATTTVNMVGIQLAQSMSLSSYRPMKGTWASIAAKLKTQPDSVAVEEKLAKEFHWHMGQEVVLPTDSELTSLSRLVSSHLSILVLTIGSPVTPLSEQDVRHHISLLDPPAWKVEL